MSLLKTKQEILSSYPTCYACDAVKTSKEHVPPRCFFPENKASDGRCLYRNNLITVPSCDKHNSGKSQDDVYALWHLAGIDGVNEIGEIMHQKLELLANDDQRRRGGAFLERLSSECIEITEDNKVRGRCDKQRMQEFLCSVARGVYFYEKYEKLIVPLKVTNIGNDFSNFEKNIILKKRERHFDSEIGDAPVLGENPKVFNYSIQVKSNGIKLVRLVFYGNLKYWVFYLPQLNG